MPTEGSGVVVVALLTLTAALAVLPISGSSPHFPGAPLPVGNPTDAPARLGAPVPPAGGAPWPCAGARALASAVCQVVDPSLAYPTALGGVRPPPMELYDFEMAYDAADGYVVLLGGVSNGSSVYPPPSEMWTFGGGAWSQMQGVTAPQNCPGSALAYDDADGYLLYFGAADQGWWSGSCASANQTWAYRGGTWSQLSPATSPPGRTGAAMTNDTSDGYVVLFGGLSAACGSSGFCNDTWEFQNGSWTELFPSVAPSPREESGFTYSGGGGHPFLFGGVGPYGSLNDSWTFSGGNWTWLTPAASPPWVQPDALSYDAADQEAVYTAAWNSSAPLAEVTWAYRAGNWSAVTAPGPTERLGAETAYDDGDGYLLFFGGYGSAGLTNATWAFVHGTWTELNLSAFGVRLTIAPGAGDVGSTYLLNASVTGPPDAYRYAYTGLPPGCTSQNLSALFCAPTVTGTYRVAVTVTNSTGGAVNDSATLVVNSLPAVRLTASASAIVAGSPVTLAATVSGGTGPYTYTWTGLPPGCASVDLPNLSCSPGAAGVFDVGVVATDAAGMVASANLTLTVAATGPAPVITSFTVAPSLDILGGPVNYSVVASGTGPLAYAYRGLPPGCASANVSQFSCLPSATGNYTSRAIVTDVLGRSATANVTLLVTGVGPPGVPLTIRSFLAAPAAVARGSVTVFQVDAVGGTLPYVFAYAQLPPGCVGLSAASLVCVPGALGNYTVTVTVTDGVGHTATSSTPLHVVPPPPPPSGPTAASTSGPTWLDFALGVLATGFGVALVLVVLLRPRPPAGPPVR